MDSINFIAISTCNKLKILFKNSLLFSHEKQKSKNFRIQFEYPSKVDCFSFQYCKS